MDRRQPVTLSRSALVIRTVLALGAITTVALQGCEVKVSRSYYQGRDAKVRADITIIKTALDAYAMQHGGNYPDSLGVLVEPDANGYRYLHPERVPRDPWDREYTYVRGQTVNVITYGRDGVEGGTGDDADIDYASIVNGR